jgi:CRP/FNR family transcriptional regulator, anaerobic regulatory protein
MPSVKQHEGGAMYVHAVVSASRRPEDCQSLHVEPSPTLKDLFNGQPTETLPAETALFWEGDKAEQVFELLEGVMRTHRIMSDGRRAIMGFIHPGDVLGVSFQDRHLVTAEAVTQVKVRRFGRGRFFTMINESPALRPQLFAILCDEMSAAQDHALLLGRKTAEERVISFLLCVRRKYARGEEIELPMSRQDIADYLGLTIETVSRTMTSLTRRGLIAPGARHTVSLCKLSALRELAGGDDDGMTQSAVQTRRAVWPN